MGAEFAEDIQGDAVGSAGRCDGIDQEVVVGGEVGVDGFALVKLNVQRIVGAADAAAPADESVVGGGDCRNSHGIAAGVAIILGIDGDSSVPDRHDGE